MSLRFVSIKNSRVTLKITGEDEFPAYVKEIGDAGIVYQEFKTVAGKEYIMKNLIFVPMAYVVRITRSFE